MANIKLAGDRNRKPYNIIVLSQFGAVNSWFKSPVIPASGGLAAPTAIEFGVEQIKWDRGCCESSDR